MLGLGSRGFSEVTALVYLLLSFYFGLSIDHLFSSFALHHVYVKIHFIAPKS